MFLIDRFFSENLDNFFTIAEKQWLILHELESVKVTTDNFQVPGHPKINLQLGSSLCKYNFTLHSNMIILLLYYSYSQNTMITPN